MLSKEYGDSLPRIAAKWQHFSRLLSMTNSCSSSEDSKLYTRSVPTFLVFDSRGEDRKGVG